MVNSWTIQQVLGQHFKSYTDSHQVDGHRLKVCRHLLNCHTPALGGIEYQCNQCHEQFPQYHSCRNRHCSQCQQRASRRWSERQQQDILPVSYFHLVFTLPHELNGWVQLHPELIYHLLFQSVWQTLKTFASDPKRLDGKLGMTAALHTWGQNLSQHVHLHCLIPGGALSHDNLWHAARSTYLFPIQALSRCFRGKMVGALRQSVKSGQLHRITRENEIDHVLDRLMLKDWVVYSKNCVNHTTSIVGYLARYSHRIAISDQRLVEVNDNQVSFRYKDYKANENKIMTLQGEEFIRRFLMHVLPKGLMRIRHYGLLANRCRKASLNKIRHILAQPIKITTEQKIQKIVDFQCPKCHQGNFITTRILNPVWLQPSIASG